MFFSYWFIFLLHAYSSEISFLDATKIKINIEKPIALDYQNSSWNQNTQAIDVGYIIVRNIIDQSLIYIELTETSPNSGYFQGIFQASKKENRYATIEIYIPPRLFKEPSIEKIAQMIQKGIIIRKPYFYRIENKQQKITIFDSKSQALEAYRYFVRTGVSKDVINPNLLENIAESSLKTSSLHTIANFEKNIAQNIFDKGTQFSQFTEEQKKYQKKEAQKQIQKGLEYYQADQYDLAKTYFEKAIELDPTNKVFFFEYGVVLYRLNEFEKAIAYLNQSETSNINQKNFFLALSYLKIKQLDLSYDLFSTLKSDSNLGALVHLYLGIIDFELERLSNSERNLKKAIEISTDSEIDDVANDYLDQIHQINRLKKERSRKFTITGFLGLIYNSNILTISPNLVSTNLSGYRSSYGFNFEYRPIFSERHEFLGQFQMSDMYSFDQNLFPSSIFQKYDPLITQITTPYRWKGTLNAQNALIAVNPFFRMMQMDLDGILSRELILNSLGIITDLIKTYNQNQKTVLYNLEIRQDDSKISVANSEDEISGTYLNLNSTHTFYKEPGVFNQGILVDWGLGFNQAKGINQTYYQIGIGGGALRPGFFETLAIGKINVTYKNFFQHTQERQDIIINVQFLSQKQINSHLQGSLMINYLINESNLNFLKYNQWLIMGQLTWQKGF